MEHYGGHNAPVTVTLDSLTFRTSYAVLSYACNLVIADPAHAAADGGRWRIGYAEHARACKSVRVLLSSFRVLRGAALPRAVELSPDGMGPVRIGVTA